MEGPPRANMASNRFRATLAIIAKEQVSGEDPVGALLRDHLGSNWTTKSERSPEKIWKQTRRDGNVWELVRSLLPESGHAGHEPGTIAYLKDHAA